MDNHITIDDACVFAWGTMESDTAIDSIVYAVASDERFPVDGGGPVSYAAFHRGDGHPVLYGVYRSDDAANAALRARPRAFDDQAFEDDPAPVDLNREGLPEFNGELR